MRKPFLRIDPDSPYRAAAGVGGIGTGLFFALEGNHTLGRNESRPGRLLEARDYCKLHIVFHYLAALLGADPSGDPFRVTPIGKVGVDAEGDRLLQEMAAAGMDTRFVETTPGLPTTLSVCFQYPDGSGGNITTTDSAAATLAPSDVDRAAGFLDDLHGRYIALAAPEVPLDARKRLLELAGGHGAFRAASFAGAEIPTARETGMFEMAELVSLNEDEAAVFGGSFDAEAPERLLEKCRESLTRGNPTIRVVITAGRNGAFGWDGRAWEHCPALPVEVAGTAGAGDALLGGILACVAAGIPLTVPRDRRNSLSDQPLSSALDLAVLLSAYSVTSSHTIHPHASLGALIAFAHRHGLKFDPLLSCHWSDPHE